MLRKKILALNHPFHYHWSLPLNCIQSTQKDTIPKKKQKNVWNYNQSIKILQLVYCTNKLQYVAEERRVYIFLYGHPSNLILKYCFAVKAKMIALVIYVPHKRLYNRIKDRLAFAMEPANWEKTQILGRGVHFYSFSDVELYSLTPILFILFRFAFYPLIVFSSVLLWLGIYFLNRLKEKCTDKTQRLAFLEEKDFITQKMPSTLNLI